MRRWYILPVQPYQFSTRNAPPCSSGYWKAACDADRHHHSQNRPTLARRGTRIVRWYVIDSDLLHPRIAALETSEDASCAMGETVPDGQQSKDSIPPFET